MMSAPDEIFTPAERKQIEQTFQSIFGSSLRRGERFAVRGSNRDGRLEVCVELADPDRTEVASFFAGHEVGEGAELSEIEARAHAVEFLHAAVHEYLQTDRYPRPHFDWRDYTFDGKKLFFRGSVVNEALEQQADAFLAAADEES